MKTRKMTALLVTAAMVMSMAGCSALGSGKAKEAVLDTASDFLDALVKLDADAMIDVSDFDEDSADELALLLASLEDDEDIANLLDAYLGSVEYVIDEESIEVDMKKGSASLDVTISHADLEALAEDEDNMVDIDTFIDAIDDAELKEDTLTLDLEQDDDEWLVVDATDFYEDFMQTLDTGDFDPTTAFGSDFSEVYIGHSWWGADDDDTYTNAYYIDFWGTYDSSMLDESPELYFTVEHDGNLVYTSDITSSADCYFYATDYTDDEYLPEGSYTVSLYTSDGTLIDSDSTYVYLTATPTVAPTVSTVDTETYWDDPSSAWADTITGWGWYDYSEGDIGDGYYSSGDTVEYDLVTSDDSASSLYYAYFYADDIEDVDISSPWCDGTVDFTAYSNANIYEFPLDNAVSGTFVIVVAESESAFNNYSVLCYSMCSVG